MIKRLIVADCNQNVRFFNLTATAKTINATDGSCRQNRREMVRFH